MDIITLADPQSGGDEVENNLYLYILLGIMAVVIYCVLGCGVI